MGTLMSMWQAVADLLGDAVGLLHDLSRRVGAFEARGAARHVVLPDGVGRRRGRRTAGGHRGAAGAAGLLGVPDRAGGHGGCWRFWPCIATGSAAWRRPMPRWMAGGGISLAIGLAIGWAITMNESVGGVNETNLETTRNFYGVLRVNSEENIGSANGPLNELVHGRIRHGFQYLDRDKRRMPTTYYGHPSGVGLALDRHPRRARATTRCGSASWGWAAARWPPSASRATRSAITRSIPRWSASRTSISPICKDSAATVDVVLGDARIKMEQELAAGRTAAFRRAGHRRVLERLNSDALAHARVRRGLSAAPEARRAIVPAPVEQVLESRRRGPGVAEILGCECVRIDSSDDTAGRARSGHLGDHHVEPRVSRHARGARRDPAVDRRRPAAAGVDRRLRQLVANAEASRPQDDGYGVYDPPRPEVSVGLASLLDLLRLRRALPATI